MHSKDARAVTEHLNNMDHVLQVLTLDAGQCVLLVISTGGYCTYMPQRGITIVSEDDALVIADSYWHKATLQKAIKAHR